MYQLVDDTNLDATLNLFLSACSDVWKDPACLFSHSSLGMIDYLIESFDKATVDYELRLVIVARQNVTNGSEARDYNRNRLMIEQFNQFFQ